MNKEQILFVVVIVLTGGMYLLDGKYQPVTIREPSPPQDVPALPALGDRGSAAPPAVKRSMFTVKPEYEDPPLVPLAEPPVPEVPVAIPPVRPFPHADAAGGFRMRLLDVAPEDTPTTAEPPADGESEVVDQGPLALPDELDAKKPLDMADYDWVQVKGGFGRSYGAIELLPADAEKGRRKWDLLGDNSLDFTWTQIDSKTGKKVSTVARFRDRVEALGFSDTLENLHEARIVQERGGRPAPDADGWKRIAEWIATEALKPRYDALEGLDYAAADMEKALRARADGETVKALGAIYRRSYRLDDELRLYDWWFTQQVGKDPEFLALRGQVYEEMGLDSAALADYEASVTTRADPATRIRAARILLRTRSVEDARRAEALFRRAEEEGERVESVVGLAEALLAQGRVADAESTLERVPQPDRGSRWFAARGAVGYLREKYQDALDYFDAAVLRSSGATWFTALGRTGKAMVNARMAVVARDARERNDAAAKAEALAAEALRDDPHNYYWPLVARAVALRARGDQAGSLDALQDAVAAAPQEPYGRYLLGEFYLRDGRPEAARTEFLEASRLAPAFPDAAAGVGRSAGGPPGEARDYLRRAVELDPRNPLWYLLAARVGLLAPSVAGAAEIPEAQRLEEARRDLAELIDRVDNKYAMGQAYYGYVLYRRGDAEGAIDAWNRAISLITPVRPGSPEEVLDRWLKDAREAVNGWLGTKIWRDEFLRPDGSQVGNGWKEEEGSGVKATLEKGAAQFGPGRNVRDQDPSIWKEWDLNARVLRGYVTVDLAANAQCDGLIDFFIPQSKTSHAAVLGLRRKETGDVFLRLKSELRDKQVTEVPVSFKWPENGRVTFGFQKEGDEGNMRVFLVEGDIRDFAASEALPDPRVQGGDASQVISAPAFAKSRGGKFRVQVGTEASAGAEVLMRVEAVAVWVDVR